MPTGVIPRATAMSSSPTVTTRLGGAGMVVLPNLCSMVTGNAALPLGGLGAGVSVVGEEPQARRTDQSIAVSAAKAPARVIAVPSWSWGREGRLRKVMDMTDPPGFLNEGLGWRPDRRGKSRQARRSVQ